MRQEHRPKIWCHTKFVVALRLAAWHCGKTKKAATRAAIADAALGLFLARGFDRVTVAEVADAAGVSVNTAFNYFPTKEDLFFDRQDEVVGRLAGRGGPARPRRESRRRGAPAAARRDRRRRADARSRPGLGRRSGGWSTRVQLCGRACSASANRARPHWRARWPLPPGPLRDDPRPRLVAAILAGLDAAVHAEIRRRSQNSAEIRELIEEASTLAGHGLGDYPG